jgi:hypothetical protein
VNNGPEITFGGGQRTFLLYRILEAKNYEIDMVALINKAWNGYEQDSYFIKKWTKNFNLIKFFRPSFKKPFFPNIAVLSWLKKHERKYDIILFRYDITAFKAGFYFLDRKKLIVDFDDFLFPHVFGLQRAKFFFLHIIQKRAIKNAWVLNKEDFKYFGDKSVWVPNLPLAMYHYEKMHSFTKRRTRFPSIIFVGAYLNELIEFLREAASKLLSINPHLTIFVISKVITEQNKQEFPHPKIKWLSDVGDVTEFYEKAWISIVPGFKKEGTHIKLIESIYYYTPAVCTVNSIRGYENFNEEEELIPAAKDNDTFVLQVASILADEQKLQDRAEKLKKVCDSKFSFANLKSSIII